MPKNQSKNSKKVQDTTKGKKAPQKGKLGFWGRVKRAVMTPKQVNKH